MTHPPATDVNTWKPLKYDQDAACVSLFGEELLGLLGPLSGAEVLDLGAGTGDLAAQIAARGARVLGVDASAEMVETANAKYGTQRATSALSFECKDGQSLDFDSRFSHVFSNAALHWMPDAESVARGVAKALRPNGVFVAEFGGKGCVATPRRALGTALAQTGEDAASWLPNWYFPSIGQYAPLLERHGLRVEGAWLFARPTRFAGMHGLRNWINLFATRAVEYFGSNFDAAMQQIEDSCRPTLWNGESWLLDYVRIRVLARRSVDTR